MSDFTRGVAYGVIVTSILSISFCIISFEQGQNSQIDTLEKRKLELEIKKLEKDYGQATEKTIQ